MGKKIIYKRAELCDELSIADFYKKAFPDQADKKYPNRFEWLYKNTPYQRKDGLLPIWLAIDEGQVVGMSSLVYQAFTSKAIEIHGAWCCDLRVLPEYRRMGIATRLEKMRMEDTNVFSVSSSAISIKIKEKLGYTARPAYTNYIAVKGLDSIAVYNDLTRYLHIQKNSLLYYLGVQLKIHQLTSWLLVLFFNGFKNKRTVISKEKKGNFIIKKIDKFDHSATTLWETINKNYGLSANRNAEYLNWKYVDQVNMNYQIYEFSYDNKAFAILVLRKSYLVGIISDIIIDPKDERFSQIFQFAVSQLLSQGSMMVMCCASIEKQKRVIEEAGFLKIDNLNAVFLINEQKKVVQKNLSTMQWLIGYGDHDLDESGKNFHPSLLTLIRILFQRIVS